MRELRPSARCVALLLIVGLTGCAEGTPAVTPRTLHAIGDSILAWHGEEGASIPHVAARTLGWNVRNEAVGGTRVLGGDEAIPTQLPEEAAPWVLVNGGLNDVNITCDCGACREVLDALVSEDGRAGGMPTLVRGIRARGSRVLVLGYYAFPPGAAFGVARCGDEMHGLNLRLARMAAAHEGVTFVRASPWVSPTHTELYDGDGVHPSRRGAERLGAALAEAVRAEDRR